MIPQDPKGINFLFSKKKNKLLEESLISLFNRTLIRSNRGASYTWHFVRLQRKKEGLHQPSPEKEAITSDRDKDNTIRQNSRNSVGRMGISASQASFLHKECLWSVKQRLDTLTSCTPVGWHRKTYSATAVSLTHTQSVNPEHSASCSKFLPAKS